MEKFDLSPDSKLRSPEEEIAFLRERILAVEKSLGGKMENIPRHEVVKEAVRTYSDTPTEKVLEHPHRANEQELKEIALDLSPEAHDEIMSELLAIIQTRGIRNALAIVEKMNDPHITDDFERFLVQYLKLGLPPRDLPEKDPVRKALGMTLYEVTVPNRKEEGNDRPLKELLSRMEQFYAGMMSVYEKEGSGSGYFAIELAVANHSDEFIFYVAIDDSKKGLFEKHILSTFPQAKIYEHSDDYNIFSEGGYSIASYAKASKHPAYPLKTYEQFDYDPLNVILNSLSKIDKTGEGASIQIICHPKKRLDGEYIKAINDLKKGKSAKEVLNRDHGFIHGTLKVADSFFKLFGDKKKDDDMSKKQKEEEKKSEHSKVNEDIIKVINEKISSPVISTNIRIVASAKDQGSAEEILTSIESAFNQFNYPQGNSITWQRLENKNLKNSLNDYSFRVWNEDISYPLSLRELSSIMHFPISEIKGASQLKIAKAGTAPAPIDLPQTGTFLGTNSNRGRETNVFTTDNDRLRHLYVIGQTGTGKTTLLKNMILQDMEKGHGVCFIDPHGSDVEDILALVPKHRIDDVIYFDPAYTPRPMALNMLEFDSRFPEQKTFVVNEMLSIFNKLFDMKVAGGPMFEQYFRNAVLLAIDDPGSGNTLIDVSRVLSNKTFRDMKLSKCTNPLVTQFWREVAEKAGGEASLQNIVPYIVSKFDNFLANEIMRPVIAQEKSSFNFREIMDNKKILLVNLSKGRLGEINANLIGLIIVGKILMSALSRVDSLGKDLPPFYLYIDEFQNVTTDSISTIFSEARKYKLSLTVAHQFIAQLDEKIKNSVFGNVGTLAVFRVGAEDAEFLEKQFEPVFKANDILNIDNYNCYLKLLADGRPATPFNISTPNIPRGDREKALQLKELSYLTYGKDRAKIEAEIFKKYQK